MTFKSPAAYEAYEAAMMEDKERVIALFDLHGKRKAFEVDRGRPLEEYLDDYLNRPGIFEGVCQDYNVPY